MRDFKPAADTSMAEWEHFHSLTADASTIELHRFTLRAWTHMVQHGPEKQFDAQ